MCSGSKYIINLWYDKNVKSFYPSKTYFRITLPAFRVNLLGEFILYLCKITDMTNNVAEKIKRLRKAKGFSQDDMAEKLHIPNLPMHG